jgi:hypothetical protein
LSYLSFYQKRPAESEMYIQGRCEHQTPINQAAQDDDRSGLTQSIRWILITQQIVPTTLKCGRRSHPWQYAAEEKGPPSGSKTAPISEIFEAKAFIAVFSSMAEHTPHEPSFWGSWASPE